MSIHLMDDRYDIIFYMLENGADYKGVMSTSIGFNYGKHDEVEVPLRGIDYWTTPIPKNTRLNIDRWAEREKWRDSRKEDYLEQY